MKWRQYEKDKGAGRETHVYLDSMCVSVYVTFGDCTVKLLMSIALVTVNLTAATGARKGVREAVTNP